MKTKGSKAFALCMKLVLYVLPFILGMIGYLMAGAGVLQALYSSMRLYLLECDDATWNIFIEIARWTAPLATASGILLVLRNLAQRIKDFWLYITGRAIIVYCGEEEKHILKKNIRNSVIVSKENFYTGAKDVIIMLGDDLENLDFYYLNERKFENSNVYLRLEQIDSFLLKEHKIKFFNETEVIARNYWKEYNLLKYMEKDALKVKIAIIGFEQLGQKLLSFGLINNIYAKE